MLANNLFHGRTLKNLATLISLMSKRIQQLNDTKIKFG